MSRKSPPRFYSTYNIYKDKPIFVLSVGPATESLMSIFIQEETCRWAYARAMRLKSVRKALNELGRAVYFDPDGAVLSGEGRFVLSRVDFHTQGDIPRRIIYCNGVCVA